VGSSNIEIPEQARIRVPVDELLDFTAEVFIAHTNRNRGRGCPRRHFVTAT
jgi:hypothetical protein